eukprot:SAG22_NODE_459_length_10228_cov_9.593642_6_plen_592_part_00
MSPIRLTTTAVAAVLLAASQAPLAGAQLGTWSEWLDRDDPSGIGDDESLIALRNDGLIPCSLPTQVECRTVNGTTNTSASILPGSNGPAEPAAWDATGQILAVGCTVENGLTCRNRDNPVLLGATPQRITCLDYEVRFFCPAEDDCTTFGGVKHPTEDVCCSAECAGYCGAVECSRGPGGPDSCCGDVIKTLGRTCGSATPWVPHALAPCVLPDDIHCDPCVCDLDGVVNGINTGRPGCNTHDPNYPSALCSVTSGCNTMGAMPSLQFPGTKWRPCEVGEPEVDTFCPVVQGEWETRVAFDNCSVAEDNYHRIPVVGPDGSQSNATFMIEHSFGAVVGARLRDAWLQCDCDLADSILDQGDPERGVRPDGRFGTYLDPVARPDSMSCKHRFYGDEWNVTVLPLDPTHTELMVRRIDQDSGWAYDGLRIDYTLCGQDATGEVKQGQGLWRPSRGFLQGAEMGESMFSCMFRRTTECSPNGPRELSLDLACTAQIREGWSGFCECADGRTTYHVGCENHPPFTCYDACRVPEDWTCDPWFYDNGACDVSCGAADPDCSRDVTVPWGRLVDPKDDDFAYQGQGKRRYKSSRGWW